MTPVETVKIRVLVCGDRDWTDYQMIRDQLATLLEDRPAEDIVVIEGEARGADSLSREAAYDLGIYQVRKFPADWKTLGKRAGPIRNAQMLKEGDPDLVWAFHDAIELSKGTKDMVDISTKAGKLVTVFAHPVQPVLPVDDLEEIEL